MNRLLRSTTTLAACFALAGCATTAEPPAAPKPVVAVQPVKIPVAVPCDPKIGPDPDYPDTDEAIAALFDPFDLAKIYRAARALRIAREAELVGALKGCAG